MQKHAYLLLLVVLLATVKISAQLTAVVTPTNPTCANPKGSATVVPSGGGGYTYKWSNGATTATDTALSPGTYTVTVYSSGGATNWDTVYYQTFDSSVQTWSINISTGANEANNNYWLISDECGGNIPVGTCGVNSNGNKTLFITSVSGHDGSGLGYIGATYDAGGFCGTLYCTGTAMAAQSGLINTAGTHNLILGFEFIAGGQALLDNASLYYSIHGATGPFTQLDPSLKSNNTGCNVEVGGNWTYKSYHLPDSCRNIANLMLRFNWVNNDDGVGTDPSIGVDNVTVRDSIPVSGTDSIVKTVMLTAPTGPHIVTTSLSITNAACGQSNGSITGLGAAGGTSPYTVQWTNSSNTVISNSYALTNVSAGSYTFQVTDVNGCKADSTFAVSPGSGNPPVIQVQGRDTICSTDSAHICVTTTYAHYAWRNGDSTQCIYAHQSGNYYVTVTDNNNCSAESNHLPLTVIAQPPVSISVNGDTLSVYREVGYQWYSGNTLIPGATSAIYIAPHPGTYAVVVTDSNGCSTRSSLIAVAINEVSADISFELYPNPVSSGLLRLVAGKELTGHEVQIFDATGKLVYSSTIKYEVTEINIEKFARGVYLVKAAGATRKFIRD